MEIVTKRFLLRDFREEDAAAFQEYHADPRSLEFYGVEECTPSHAPQLLETLKNWTAEKPRRNYQFAVAQRQGSQLLVGCCGLRTADSEAGKAELGIELGPEFWGRYGYSMEVIHALVDFGFGTLGLRGIYGRTVSPNIRDACLATSFGAVATIRQTPVWMAARGWSQIEMEVLKQEPFKRVQWKCEKGPVEWIGTDITFDLNQENDFTIVLFGHRNWRESIEFTAHCSTKWAVFLMSLKELIETGTGKPAPRDIKIDNWN